MIETEFGAFRDFNRDDNLRDLAYGCPTNFSKETSDIENFLGKTLDEES